jgi:hypothetical protein
MVARKRSGHGCEDFKRRRQRGGARLTSKGARTRRPAARSHTWQPTTVPLPQHATGNGHPQHPAHTPPCPSRGHSLRFGAIVFPVTVTVTQRPHGSHSGGSATSTGQRALDMPCHLTLALGMSTPGKCEQSPRIVFRERTRDVLRYLPWYPIRVCIIPPVIAHRLRLAQTLVTHDIRHCFRPCSNFELPRFRASALQHELEAQAIRGYTAQCH